MFQGLCGYGVGGFVGGGNHFGGGGRGGRGGSRGGTHISSEQFRKLFVGGLNYETDEESLKSHFEQWGEIVDCVVMRDPDTKSSRGFGFITYKDSSMIDEAQKNRPHRIDNREVETKRAMPRDADGASNYQSVKKMFVGGLKDDTTEEQMRDVFSQFGEIESVNILADTAPGKCRGFAFVTYKDYDSVDRAVLLKRHDLNTRRVEVKKAIPKDQMDRSGRGGGSAGWGRGRVIDSFGCGPCGYSPFGPFGGGYGGGGYGGVFAGGQNLGGSGGYGSYNSSWGGGFGSIYGSGPVKGGRGGAVKGVTGGPVKCSSDMQLEAGDLMDMAVDKLAVAAGSMVVDSDINVATEAAEYPEHMDIQSLPRTRKRKHENPANNVVEEEAED
ncbi:hypothetical protein BsWGS_09524 [Bradybaena similaris]